MQSVPAPWTEAERISQGREVSESFHFLLCLHTSCIHLKAHTDLTHKHPHSARLKRSPGRDGNTLCFGDERSPCVFASLHTNG